MKNSENSFAMPVWIKAISIALLAFLTVMLSIEVMDRAVFRPKSIFARSVGDFEKQKEGIQLLFLGQSDVQFDIVPSEFKYRSYNLAGSGESFIETYYKLKHYIPYMPELKMVVLSVTMPTFSSYRANEIQWEYFAYGYINFTDLMELYKIKGPMAIREKLLSFCPVVKRMPMINFLRNVKKLINKEPIGKTTLVQGHVENPGINATEEGALKRGKRQFEGQNTFDDNFLLYFEKILKLCNDNNIKVFIVTLPVSSAYLENSKKYITMDMVHSKALNNPVYSKYIYRYLDLSGIYVNNNNLFLNQDHLNDNGALKVSKLISSEWSKPMDDIINAR